MVEIITATNTASFNADWASPPGDLIEEVLEERGWSRAELAQRLAFSAKHVNELLKGRAPITADTAERLERVLGHGAGFWLKESLRRGSVDSGCRSPQTTGAEL